MWPFSGGSSITLSFEDTFYGGGNVLENLGRCFCFV